MISRPAALGLLAVALLLGGEHRSRAQGAPPVEPPAGSPAATTGASTETAPSPAEPPEGPPPPEAEARFDTPLSVLTAGWPGIGGRLSGPARVHASWRASREGVHRTFVVESDAAIVSGHVLGRLDARIELPPDGPARLEVSTRGGVIDSLTTSFVGEVELDLEAGTLRWSGGEAEASVEARGLDLAILGAFVPAASLVGRADVTLRMTGTRQAPVVDATLRSPALSWRGIPAMPFEGTWKHQGDASRVEAAWGSDATARLVGTATIPVSVGGGDDFAWNERGAHELEITGERLDARVLAPFVDLPRRVEATIALRASLRGALDALEGAVSVTGTLDDPGRVTIPVAFEATTKGGAQAFDVSMGELWKVQLATKAAWGRLQRGEAAWADVPIEGRVVVDAPLADVVAFLPDAIASPVGRFAGTVEVAGTAGAPSWTGVLAGHDVALTLVELHQRLSPLDVEVSLSGGTATLTKLSGRAGRGALTGKGAFDLTGSSVSGDVELSLASFPFVQPGLPLGTIDGHVDVALARTGTHTRVDVEVREMAVRLTEQELPSTRAIPSNQRVLLLDWLGRATSTNELFGGVERDAHLRVSLVDPIDVRGAKFAMHLSGTLDVERRADVVTVRGGFDARKGDEFQLFDNPFLVRSGRVTILPGVLGRRRGLHLTGVSADEDERALTVELRDPDRPTEGRPLDAVVDFTAEGQVIETQVVVQVRGPASRPELVLLSNPPLPEYQILALLITGRVDAVDEENGEVRRKAAELVQSFHNPSLKRQLFDRMGVDKIGLGFGASAAEPILTVGKQLDRRVYVESIYHHNAPPEENTTAGRVEYRLDPWWTVDTTVGDAGNGNLGVFWTLRFGGPPPPGPEALAKLGVRPPPDRDGDRIADPVDQCLDDPEDADGYEDDDGCPDDDNDGDGVADANDRAPNDPETRNGYEDEDGAPDEAPKAKSGLAIAIAPVAFRPGSARPRADQGVLQSILALMEDLRDVQLTVVGHADARGKPETNLKISERRAESARQLLVRLGADAERLSVVGRGSAEPLDTADTAEARARNRRVELEVTPTVTETEAGTESAAESAPASAPGIGGP